MYSLTGYSLTGTLSQVAPKIPDRLVSPEALSRAYAVGKHLPAALTSWTYLECRLGADAPQVDITVGVDARGRDILAGRNPVIRLGPDLEAHPTWQQLRRFAREWCEPTSLLHAAVERIWLEFDIPAGDASRHAVPVPGVFVEFAPAACLQGDAATRFRLAAESLRGLAGRELPGRTARHLRACLERLPPNAHVRYLGLLLSRGSDAVRVCVLGLTDAQLPSYLQAIGWPGSVDELAGVTAPLSQANGAAGQSVGVLNFDVAAAVLPPLGLEYAFLRDSQLRGEIVERDFLDRLVRRGLCTPEKRDGLLAWPGAALAVLRHELWRSLLVRRVNHVKVMYEPGRPLVAKGYICFFHEFYSTRDGARAAAREGARAA